MEYMYIVRVYKITVCSAHCGVGGQPVAVFRKSK